MALDLSGLADYSWAQIKLSAKTAMVSAMLGGANLTINGRNIARVTPEEARKIYEWATEMELLDSGDAPGGLALVRWGERV